VVGKILLKSNGGKLLPLLVKVIHYFQLGYPFFIVTVPLQLLVAEILNVTK
jgi:hypothetical protein